MNYLDLFSGIGGFHLGLEQAGFKFDWVGFAEIDKYASSVYKKNFPDSIELGDVESISGRELPKIDIITFGSPCQDFSVGSRGRLGLRGNRSSLITQAIRLIDECRPRIFIWENVKGTFSTNNGSDFFAIIQAFANLGTYRIEWELCDTMWFLPQSRSRIYLTGYLGGRSGREVFPLPISSRKSNKRISEIANPLQHPGNSGGNYRGMNMVEMGPKKIGDVSTKGHRSMWGRVYDPSGTSVALNSHGGGMGAKTGLYEVHTTQPRSGNPEQGGTGPLSRDDGNTYCLDTGNSQAVENKSTSRIRRLTPTECSK